MTIKKMNKSMKSKSGLEDTCLDIDALGVRLAPTATVDLGQATATCCDDVTVLLVPAQMRRVTCASVAALS